MSPRPVLWAAVVVAVALGSTGRVRGAEGSPVPPSWQAPPLAEVRAELFTWLDQRQPDEATRAAVQALWPTVETGLAGPELLARLSRSFALVDANARQLVELCSKPKSEPTVTAPAWLRDAATPPLMAHNLRLLYGRWLVHESLYDEAREQLAGLTPEQVVDPASLLFYQGVVAHRLLDAPAGMKAIDRLLEGTAQSPKRYAAVARLMREDLKDLKPDSLDHIARRMEDVRRRLSLGRAGQKVRQVEDEVITSLDKMIREAEEEQQKRQQQASGGGGGSQSPTPATESRIAEGKGSGQVTKKELGDEGGWGNLPPKEREEALQQIGRDFPAHYRDVIEQYFRRLASEKNE